MVRQFLRWLWAAKSPTSACPVPVCQLVVFCCAVFGGFLTLGGGCHWAQEGYYAGEWEVTETGVVAAKWQETRPGSEGGGPTTADVFRCRFRDRAGVTYEYLEYPGRADWNRAWAGKPLPPIEYAASDPGGVHRYASDRGLGRRMLVCGLALLAAIVPIRLVYGAATWRIDMPGLPAPGASEG